MRITVKVENFEECKEAMRRLPQTFMSHSEDGILKCAEIVRDQAKANFVNAPAEAKPYRKSKRPTSQKTPPYRRTGELQSLIEARIDGKGTTHVVAHAGISKNASKEQAIIAGAVEFGHKPSGWNTSTPVPPHPYLRPAAYNSKKAMAQIMEEAMVKAMNEAGENDAN